MIIVSDTSPVSNLILIGRLSILRELFGKVIVPPAVDAEIRALKTLGKDISEYDSVNWIKVVHPRDPQKVAVVKLGLDEGEAQAITVALEIGCDLLLMDERIGTSETRENGLRTLGLIGVLIKAKEVGKIENVRDIIAELKSTAGFWLSSEFENTILRQIGEV